MLYLNIYMYILYVFVKEYITSSVDLLRCIFILETNVFILDWIELEEPLNTSNI